MGLPSPILETMRGIRAFLVALGLLALGLGLYTWASPYLFLRDLQGAILEGDRARLERMVDFPRVREGLKAQIHAQLLKEVGKEVQANPFAGLAYLFAAGLVDPLVEVLVSPEGLAALGTGAGPRGGPQGGGEELAAKVPRLPHRLHPPQGRSGKPALPGAAGALGLEGGAAGVSPGVA